MTTQEPGRPGVAFADRAGGGRAVPWTEIGVALGLDIGHSAVKVATRGGTRLFPSCVCAAIPISDRAEARRAEGDTFSAPDGNSYFVGETAQIQGSNGGPVGLYDRWIDTPEYAVLIKAAYAAARAIDPPLPGAHHGLVVMGLPASLYASQSKRLISLARDLLGIDVLVVPQPYAPYAGLKLERNGFPAVAYAGKENYGVIEIGYYTTDFSLIQRDRPVERASVSCGGVRIATENLQRLLGARGLAADMGECEIALRERRIRNFDRNIDITKDARAATEPMVAEIIDNANRVLESHARKVDGIILAGGGCDLVRARLAERWPHLVVPDEPRFAVAEGMRRLGEMTILSRRMGAA